jgi:hypothetical protein
MESIIPAMPPRFGRTTWGAGVSVAAGWELEEAGTFAGTPESSVPGPEAAPPPVSSSPLAAGEGVGGAVSSVAGALELLSGSSIDFID